MQTLIEPPRDGLTAAQVVWLLQDAPIKVGYGAELIGMDLNVIRDLGQAFGGGNVARNAYADLHGEGDFSIFEALDWGTSLVRPYQTITSGGLTARFNLGAYFTNTPVNKTTGRPRGYEVKGYDILSILDDPVGESYTVAKGEKPLAWVEQILIDRGVQAYYLDQTAADKTLPSPLTWAIDDEPTWLTIVNKLLASVAYQGMWSDWNGRLRGMPYQVPTDRGVEWVYRTTDDTSLLEPERELAEDWYLAPNRWVGVRSNNVDGPPPVEGDGIYTVQNDTNGKTSVAARGGRVITAPIIKVDATDQSAVIAAVQARVAADMRLDRTITVSTSPMPLHWHFDRIAVRDPELGEDVFDCMSTSWRLPLDGDPMAHTWTVL